MRAKPLVPGDIAALPVDLTGQRAIVTAGAAGIGAAIAGAFAARGAQVHVCDVDEQALAACPLFLASPFGAMVSGQAIGIDGDLQSLPWQPPAD